MKNPFRKHSNEQSGYLVSGKYQLEFNEKYYRSLLVGKER